MANKYKKIFHNLFESNIDVVKFTELNINIGSIKRVIKCSISKELLLLCSDIASEKSKKTMSYSQDLNERSERMKVANMIRGVVGETIIHVFLLKKFKCNFEKILRYDLERETFDYSTKEYDLKYNEKKIEVRTSNNPKISISDYLQDNKRGVIFSYTNAAKTNERVSDFAFCIVYDYPNLAGPATEERKLNFINDILNEKLFIYLITGSTKEEALKSGVFGSYGQNNTKYFFVPFLYCQDIYDFLKVME